jgi:glycine/D-amino acid oxidase-like deaminating enzyme
LADGSIAAVTVPTLPGSRGAVVARPIEESCYWLAFRPAAALRPLEGERRADIAVVGAGLTGLWAAIFLKQLDPAVDIAVVEQGVAAYGGSGRNAGMLSETIDHGHQLAIEHFGLDEARLLARLGRENVDEMLAFLRTRNIDCDYEPVGRLMVALSDRQLAESHRTVETAERLGVTSFRFLEGPRIRAELDSPLYQGGVQVSSGGILDPVKLVDGLRREAEGLGVKVHERSRIARLDRVPGGVRLIAEGGSLTAPRVILATSAYTHHLLPALTARFIPLYDYILVSEPLSPPRLARVGWRNRQGVTDGRTFFNYYRLTRDNRILWGTSEAAYYGGNRVDPSCDHSEPHYESLRASFRRHFPPLADLEFTHAWGGAICSTTRMTPFCGAAMGGRVLYGLGYTGHGLGSTRLIGRVLAHQALGRPSPLLDLALVRRKPLPYPPEPFRTRAVDAVTRALRRVDAGETPNLLLKLLDFVGIGFSS